MRKHSVPLAQAVATSFTSYKSYFTLTPVLNAPSMSMASK